MSLTERERTILQLAREGLTDYRIARKINANPPNVTRSRKNAYKKLEHAKTNLEWAQKNQISLLGTGFYGSDQEILYNFFL